MEFWKGNTTKTYDLEITRRTGDDLKVFSWTFTLDATGLAALIRTVETATNEGKMARSIGLRRKRKAKGD